MYRILIVDDEHVVAETLRMVFEKNGFTTCTAYSADEAMDRASSFAPDLLLCDLNMPEKDGVALITEMDGVYPSCRILVLSGATAAGGCVSELSGKLRRRLSVLSKPCPPKELLRVAGSLLA